MNGLGDTVLRLEAFLAGLKCWVLALEGLLAFDDRVPSRTGETEPDSVRSEGGLWLTWKVDSGM